MSYTLQGPDAAKSVSNQYEAYKLFSKLTLRQQEDAIKHMNLSSEDEKIFREAMAYMKLFFNKPYQNAVKKAMGEALYHHFNTTK